ncbi:hypothetical protein ABZT51_30885 [Streptomyces sp. NPDC005373]|uniref:hypothetical protein n=1 Tax=unclassified Streptomyces TaxID=2593676 RepID=UPI0033BB6276
MSGRDEDLDLAVRLLAGTPTHEGRDPLLIRQWALVASEFGSRMTPPALPVRVVERDGGLAAGLLARYRSRPPVVEIYVDTVDRAGAGVSPQQVMVRTLPYVWAVALGGLCVTAATYL